MPWEHTRLLLGSLEWQGSRLVVANRRCIAGLDREEALLQPRFSPDGVLHVCSDRDGWWNIHRLEGHALVPVCPMRSEIGGPPWVFGQGSFDFLRDGSLIAAAIEDGQSRVVCIANGQAVELAIGAIAECPVVLGGGQDGRGRLGWLRAAPAEPAAVLLGTPDGTAMVLAQAHGAIAHAEDISVAESIRYPVAQDGFGEAFFYPPANSRYRIPDGERPPLMVIVHGGPTGMTSSALSLRVQWWTSRGIAVVDVNYSGSSGFGRAYRQRLDGGWGVVDVDDCIAACKVLTDAGRVDAARIAIRGSSAGGFTVLAALTRFKLFAAGTCIYGIGDLKTLAEETHKFEANYLDRLIGPWPEAAAIYEARSPINRLEALGSPVIFFHGTEDKVVPISQARGMAQALRDRDIPHALHEFAGEGHGFRRAGTMRRLLELELGFYGEIFGFSPASVPAER